MVFIRSLFWLSDGISFSIASVSMVLGVCLGLLFNEVNSSANFLLNTSPVGFPSYWYLV